MSSWIQVSPRSQTITFFFLRANTECTSKTDRTAEAIISYTPDDAPHATRKRRLTSITTDHPTLDLATAAIADASGGADVGSIYAWHITDPHVDPFYIKGTPSEECYCRSHALCPARRCLRQRPQTRTPWTPTCWSTSFRSGA